ncbi:MAG: PDZ domain-containing protein, partial [Bacteroidales bacterium]|nr:PDZ domain-containing protein [Bacteroidales bacterium]
GGPAEQAGLRAGDMIVSINDSSFVGSTITNERVMKTLRGEKTLMSKWGSAEEMPAGNSALILHETTFR